MGVPRGWQTLPRQGGVPPGWPQPLSSHCWRRPGLSCSGHACCFALGRSLDASASRLGLSCASILCVLAWKQDTLRGKWGGCTKEMKTIDDVEPEIDLDDFDEDWERGLGEKVGSARWRLVPRQTHFSEERWSLAALADERR